MKIIYKHGNILEAVEGVCVQGCNAQGVMGSGLAKLIRDKYPMVFEEYRRVYELQGNVLNLGQNIWVNCPDGFTVVNSITQKNYGRDSNVLYASYDGFRESVIDINYHARNAAAMAKTTILMKSITSIAYPLICCGLANGKWSIVSKILEEESTDFQPVVYLLDGIIPDGITGDVIKA